MDAQLNFMNIDFGASNDAPYYLKTCIITNKKAPEGAISDNGAGNGNMLQLLAPVIAKELEHLKTDEMLCYA